jgi:hypothetical protein
MKALNSNLRVYSASPQPVKRLIAFRSAMNRLAIDSYLGLAKEFERATEQSMSNVCEWVSGLDPSRALDSSLYACVEGATLSMEAEAPDAAENFLKWCVGRNVYADFGNLKIGPPDSSPAVVFGMDSIRKCNTKDVFGRTTRIYATSKDDIDGYVPCFREALDMINTADPQMHREIVEIVHRAVLFKAIAFMGGSMPQTLGTMFISLPEGDPKWGVVPYFVEHIVHESSHNMLFAMMHSDAIILNDASESFKAPLRTDKRHMYGVYHASFVVSRMLHIFRSLANKGYREYEPLVEHFEPRLLSGLAVIADHGKLSEAGRHLFETFASTAGMSARA